MFWAASCTAFFDFLPSSEFTTCNKDPSTGKLLALSDASVDEHLFQRHVFLSLCFSKTDQFGKGCTLALVRSDSVICPVEALTLSLVPW